MLMKNFIELSAAVRELSC